MPQFVMHRHPDHWEQPESFFPGHFSPDQVRKRHKFAWFPFGGGPRNCIGLHLASMEIKLFLSLFVRRMTPEVPSDFKLGLRPGITLYAASEIPVKLTPVRD